MGIRFFCPNGHKLNVKAHLAGKRGLCPTCAAKVRIPFASTRPPGKKRRRRETAQAASLEARAGSEASGDIAAWLEEDEDLSSAIQSRRSSSSREPSTAPHPQKEKQDKKEKQGDLPAPLFEDIDLAALEAMGVPESPPPAQPIAGATFATSEAVWYVRPPGGGQFGPASSEVIITWIREGRVPAESLVWREGWRDWQKAAEAFAEPGRSGRPVPRQAILPAPPLKPLARKAVPPKRSGIDHSTLLIGALGVGTLVVLIVLVWMLVRRAEAPPSTEPVRGALRSSLSSSLIPGLPPVRLPH